MINRSQGVENKNVKRLKYMKVKTEITYKINE